MSVDRIEDSDFNAYELFESSPQWRRKMTPLDHLADTSDAAPRAHSQEMHDLEEVYEDASDIDK